MLLRVFYLLLALFLAFIAVFSYKLADSEYAEISQSANRNAITHEIVPPKIGNHLNKIHAPFSEFVFPDIHFRRCLQATRKQKPELIYHLKCRNKSIKNTTGLIKLKNLRTLDLSNNEIQSIRTIPQQQLIELNLSHNKLGMLNIKSSALQKLNIENNRVYNIDIGSTPQLTEFKASNNMIRTLMLDAPKLSWLDVSNNWLEELKIKRPENLQTVLLSNNKLSAFDFNHFDRLKLIDLRNNKINQLLHTGDVKHFTLFIDGNGMFSRKTAFNLIFEKAKIISLDLPGIDFPDPVLRDCIAMARENNFEEIKSLGCFKAKAMLHNNKKINDLTGLDKLTHLERLTLNDHEVESIDLSPFKQLNYINLDGNQLSNVDLSHNQQLLQANFSNNNLSTFKASNKRIRILNLNNNKLNKIDLTGVPNLRSLSLKNNGLTTLDISNLSLLRQLDVSSNRLNTIGLDKIPYLQTINLENNPWNEETYRYFRDRFWPFSENVANEKLFKQSVTFVKKYSASDQLFPDPTLRRCITKHVNDAQVNSYSEIDHLSCQGRDIKNPQGLNLLNQLKHLSLQSTRINSIELSTFKNLVSLTLRNNPLKSLDLRGTSKLKSATLNNNKLQIIKFDPAHDLIYLQINNNNLSELDVHSMPSLTKIFAQDNQIKSLKLDHFPSLTHLNLANNFINSIDVRYHLNLKYLYLNNNFISHMSVQGMQNLVTLQVANNRLQSLDITGALTLKSLQIFGNRSFIPKISGTSVEIMQVDSNQYKSLKNTNQLSQFLIIEKYEPDRYFLKKQ